MEVNVGLGLSFFLLTAVVSDTTNLNPCRNYVTLEEPWRATTFTLGPKGPLHCDNQLVPGWYRFAGAVLPNVCPDSYSCGTRDPVWMTGQVPGPEDGSVNRTACAVTNNADGVLDCCGQEVTIQVRNCGSFILYYLYSTPICPMAYCVDADPVPLARNSDLWASSPSLGGPEIVDGGFRFTCTVPEVTHEAYDVVWTFDGETVDDVPVETLRDGNRVAFLDQQAWVGRIGKELRCSVRGRNDSTRTVAGFVDSEGYWGGIQIHPPTLTVSEGQGPQEVTLRSTLPVVCPSGSQCELQLELDVQGTRWEDIAAAESCLLRLRSADWNDRTRTVSVSTRIMATRDFVHDGNQNLVVRFRPVYHLAPPVWSNYTPPELQVLTLDRETSRCFGYADPHIQGLELPDVFHLYDEGDFVLLRSEQNNFEVQIRTRPCAGRACICGVAVQHEYDAISLSLCDLQGELPPEIRIVGDNDLQVGTTITRARDGRNYMIAFASGEWVKVTDFRSYLNVEVQVTGSEFGVTSGLCGTFDNNTQNDLTAPDGRVFPYSTVPQQFTETWRIPGNESLFSGVLRPVLGVVSRTLTQQCMCNADTGIIDCGLTRAIMDPARDNHGCSDCDITNDVNRWRLNGGMGDDDMDEDEATPFFLGNVTPTLAVLATSLPVSRDTAHRTCVTAMMNQSLSLQCAGAVTLQLSSFVTSCVEDMMASGSQEFLLSSVASWEGACANDVIRDLANYHTDDATGRVEPPRVLTTDVCPGQCAMKGQCVAGTCVCDAGFAGVDCSVRVDNPPVLLRIVRNGLCDASRRPCRVAFLTVDNFMSTPNITCRIRDVKMTPQGPVVDTTWRTVAADFLTNRQAACHMPDSNVPGQTAMRAYYISIATDGQRFSNEAIYVVYDVTCLDCDVTGNCSARIDACLIDDLCYTNQELHPTNSNLVCDPVRSSVRWSSQDTPSANVERRGGDLCTPMTLTFTRWDVWTSNQTGCPCHFNQAAATVCACCEAGACQCPAADMHQCVLCGRTQDCGTRQQSPDFGVDGWTSSTTGCACLFDTSRDDCACCQHGGCQCPRQFRNQCVPCGRAEVCGSKPDVFGPPLL